MILGNRHLVVVHQNEKLPLKFARGVEPLECLAAGERAVADDSNHLLRSAEQLPGLRHAERKIDRDRGVPEFKEVVRALLRIRVGRDIVVVRGVRVSLPPPGQHFVRIGLVGDVVDDFILRRGKNRVERYGRLNEPEIRPHMSHMPTRADDECLPHLGRERRHFFDTQLLHIRGAVDCFQIHVSYLVSKQLPDSSIIRAACAKENKLRKKQRELALPLRAWAGRIRTVE